MTESIEDRLPSITDQILSRSRLERIILEMDLYKAERARQVMEDVVEPDAAGRRHERGREGHRLVSGELCQRATPRRRERSPSGWRPSTSSRT